MDENDEENVRDNPKRENFFFLPDTVVRDSMLLAPPQNPPETPEDLTHPFHYPGNKSPVTTTAQGSEQNENVPSNIININLKALSKYSQTYELEKFKKNFLLIFNHKYIYGYQPRTATEKDVEALTETFKIFGFEIFVENDLTLDEILQKLDEVFSQDFTDYGCVAVAVLTHGGLYGDIRAKDRAYSELEIIKRLKVDTRPTLVSKPKLVIIQACRGDEDITGVPVMQVQSSRIQKDSDKPVDPYHLPVESDMLIFHSSFIGKSSLRDVETGSWFIQSLCKHIQELAATLDLESIFTQVKREVAIEKSHSVTNRATGETDMDKQMPVSTSTLIRKLFLKTFDDSAKSSSLINGNQLESTQDSNPSAPDGTVPCSPLRMQFDPCYCFLEHFNYMRSCLRYYLESCPEDEVGKNCLDVAVSFDETSEFNSSKKKHLKLMSSYLATKANESRHEHLRKYLYLYKS